MCGDENSLVLDFFAGSCTTAQAVLEMNHEDGGRRRFLMVQLPVPTGNPELPTICEIGKARIRQVIARLKQTRAEGPDLVEGQPPADLGFQVWQLLAASPHGPQSVSGEGRLDTSGNR
jgi:adenine-specific DNA-methyltransferase